jgi:hypothetical protein
MSDGYGGAFFAWMDSRNSGPPAWDIYAQRLDASGMPVWQTNGVPICTAPDAQLDFKTASDGKGGMLVVWDDYRDGANFHVEAQRINSSGQVIWATNGAPVFTGTSAYQNEPDIAPDGNGGAFIVWFPGGRVYAQHVNATGSPTWATNGIPLTVVVAPGVPRILGDGTGGAFITWGMGDLYAQRIDAAGNLLWSPTGVLVCNAPDNQDDPQITPDNAGGAIIAWVDYRTSYSSITDIYAQRLGSNGIPQWQTNGVPVSIASGEERWPRIVGDGAGGAIVSWERYPTEGVEVRAQHLSPSGVATWLQNGIPVCTAPANGQHPQIVATGQGESVIVWQDQREPVSGTRAYGQHLDATGAFLWTANGVPLNSSDGTESELAAVADSQGGVITGWRDYRSGQHIYAQRTLLLPVACPSDHTMGPGARQRFAISLYNNTDTANWAYYSVQGDPALTFEMESQPNGFQASLAGAQIVDPHTTVTLPAWVRVATNALPGDATFRTIRGFIAQSPDTCLTTVHIGSSATGVGNTPSIANATLSEAVPNPFSSETRLIYSLPIDARDVSLSIYDASGQLVRKLAINAIKPGQHVATWDGRDEKHAMAPSGVYFCVLRSADFKTTKKILLLR